MCDREEWAQGRVRTPDQVIGTFPCRRGEPPRVVRVPVCRFQPLGKSLGGTSRQRTNYPSSGMDRVVTSGKHRVA